MAFSSATLSTQLQAISGSTEAAARVSWSGAWATYFAGAVAGAVPFTTNPTHIATARAAMEAAMVGLSVSGQGAAKIQAGIIAWWDALVANAANYFAGASSITKPSGLTSIASNMGPILTSNKNTAASASVACGAIAAQIHADNGGGSANISGAQTIA
jgi:hypothetical protein